jgi:hypothetical protein
MGCLGRLTRLLVLGVVVVGLLALLLPRFVAQAGNSLLNDNNNNAPSLSGLALFIPANFLDKNNKLQISLSGLTANYKYEVTLDPGACGNSGYKDIGTISTDSSGNVTTTFNLSSLDTSKNWYVNIHNGPFVYGAALACSQLNINNASAAVEATNTVLQLSPVVPDANSAPMTPGATPTAPTGFPNTGASPGGNGSYDNNVYPRKF